MNLAGDLSLWVSNPSSSEADNRQMAKTPPRDITPVTGEEWRNLGFYHELDPDRRVWRLCGSRSGLVGFARLVARYVETSVTSPDAQPLPLGPYGDLQIRLWERPGIDDESVYGSSDDLLRLAQLVESRLADKRPGEEVVIGPEYAGDAECSLVFEIMDDDFDPAVAVTPVSVEDLAPAPAAVSPPVAFKFHSPEGTECEGVVRLEGADLVIQYEKKDWAATVAKIRDAFVGSWRSGVKDMTIPLSEITLARFKRGVFGANLTLQVKDIKLIEGVPPTKLGTIRLNFRRADRDDAANLAAAIDELLEEARW
jgi:hypothetical protein